MSDKLQINPAALAAVEHYAAGRFNFAEPKTYVHEDGKGHRTAWPLERACGVAAEVLGSEHLAYLKLERLKAGLKKYGLDALYERIMGEELSV